MSASLSSAVSSSPFLLAKRGQLRETLAGLLSSPWLLYVLFFSPLGLFGLHHAWLGHWKRFLAYLITFGLYGGGWLYDLLHFSDLAKEQHDQQHQPSNHSTAVQSPCTTCAVWALQVEGKAAGAKNKPDGSTTAPRFRPAASAAASSSAPAWSSPMPPVATTQQPVHHSALADAFPLGQPPQPSHTHHKRRSDEVDGDKPVSVRVRSAEIEDCVEKMRAAESKALEVTARQHKNETDRVARERQVVQSVQREEEMKGAAQHDGEHERAISQEQDAQGSRQQLKQAILEQHHTTSSSETTSSTNNPVGTVVYLKTIAPSQGTTHTADTAQTITFSPSPQPNSLPLKAVEPVAVLRPMTGGGDTDKPVLASSTTLVTQTVASHVQVAPVMSVAAVEADDETGADGSEEQQRDGSSHGNGNGGGRGGQAGNGGGRRRSGRGRRG